MSALTTTARRAHSSQAVAVIGFLVSSAVTVATVRARRGLEAMPGTGRRSVLHGAVDRRGTGPVRDAAASGATAEEGGARIYHLPVRPSTSEPPSGRGATVIALWG